MIVTTDETVIDVDNNANNKTTTSSTTATSDVYPSTQKVCSALIVTHSLTHSLALIHTHHTFLSNYYISHIHKILLIMYH